MATAISEISSPGIKDRLHIRGYDHVELYVGNARQAAHFYRTALGFTPVAYAGPETGVADRISFAVEQGEIRLVLTSALSPESPIAEHVNMHGDGVRDIAFRTDDAVGAFEEAVGRGARPVSEPTVLEDEHGQLVRATVATFGDTVHSFIERNRYAGRTLPGYRPLGAQPAPHAGLTSIDHIAVTAERGQLDHWIEFYKEVLDFRQSHQEDVTTEHSAMNSKVVQDRTGRIKFPMMEPAASKRKSQIEEYLHSYRGAGAQHLALLSDDILQTVRTLRLNGVEFLSTPETYYQLVTERIGQRDVDVESLREMHILYDNDPAGYLLQIFTKPIQSRPTMFIEVIQRQGAEGFGGGNIKALFEAVEREQALRGNL